MHANWSYSNSMDKPRNLPLVHLSGSAVKDSLHPLSRNARFADMYMDVNDRRFLDKALADGKTI